MNTFIELTGIPGCGKTFAVETALKHIPNFDNNIVYDRVALYKEREIKYYSILGKTILFLKALVYTPVFKLFMGLLLGRFESKTIYTKIKYFVKIILQQQFIFELAQKCDKTVFVIDEGFIHLGGVLLENAPDKYRDMINDSISKLIIKYYKSCSILFLDDNVEKCFLRLNKREQGWPPVARELEEDKKREYLVHYKEVISLQKCYFTQNGCDSIKLFSLNQKDAIDYMILAIEC